MQRVGRSEEVVQRLLPFVERLLQRALVELPPHRGGVQLLVGQVHRP